jgi:hypothetical protein
MTAALQDNKLTVFHIVIVYYAVEIVNPTLFRAFFRRIPHSVKSIAFFVPSSFSQVLSHNRTQSP